MSTPPSEEQYGGYISRVARGAGISSLGQGIGRILNYATQVALARMYGPALLGLYVLGTITVFFTNVLAQFGMDSGVVRYVAHHRAQGDVSRVRGTILLALFLSFAFSLVFAALMFFGAGFLAERVFDKPALENILQVFAVALPFFTVMSIALCGMQGFQTVRRQTYVRQILQPLANLALIVVFYLLGAQILGAALAYVLSMVFGSALALFYLIRLFPKLLDRETPAKFEPRALFGVSGPMIVANFTHNINPWATVTVLGIFSSASTVGIYHAATRTASLSTLVLFGFAGIFSPMIANLHSRGSLDHLSYLYKDVSRWTFTGSLPIFLITVLLAEDVMAVFGEEFISGAAAMVLIAAAHLFGSSAGHTGRVLAMTGHQRTVMLSTVGSTIACVILAFVLIPPYGLLGAASATAVSIVVANVFTLFAVRRLHGFWPYNRAYAKPAAAGALATAGTYLAQLTLPIQTGILSLLVFASLFMILFAAFLLVLGLSHSDRQFLDTFWTAVRRALGRDDRSTPE